MPRMTQIEKERIKKDLDSGKKASTVNTKDVKSSVMKEILEKGSPRLSEAERLEIKKALASSEMPEQTDSPMPFKRGGEVKVRGQGVAARTKKCKIY